MSTSLKVSRVTLYALILGLSAKEKKSNIAGWFVTGLQIALRISIYSGMYRVALGSNNSQFVNGIWAIAFSQLIWGGERPQLSLQIGREIKDGTLSMYLLRPASYINQAAFSYIGRSIPDHSSIAVFGFSTAFLLTGEVPFSIVVIPFIFLLVCVGILLVVTIEVMLGLTGFWTTDTSGVQLMNHKLSLLFGGIIIPFALLPETIADIVRYTPWTIAIAGPGNVATHFEYSLFLQALGVALCWCACFYLLAMRLYRKGIEKLNIGGG